MSREVTIISNRLSHRMHNLNRCNEEIFLEAVDNNRTLFITATKRFYYFYHKHLF